MINLILWLVRLILTMCIGGTIFILTIIVSVIYSDDKPIEYGESILNFMYEGKKI